LWSASAAPLSRSPPSSRSASLTGSFVLSHRRGPASKVGSVDPHLVRVFL
jgi:hypothetical protein